MALFDTKVERNNKFNSDVIRVNTVSVREWMPDGELNLSMSVFGGHENQRNAVIGRAISRCYGKFSIIVLHNNLSLENMLSNFQNYYLGSERQCPKVPTCFISGQNPQYTPFLDMSPARICEAIYPTHGADMALRAQALSRYVDILRFRHIPVNLDNLIRISSMTIDEIEENQMAGVPEAFAKDTIALLSQNNIHMQVKADINQYASFLDGRIWTGAYGATDVNMVTAIKRNAVLSVRMPANNLQVLDYFAAELSFILDMGYHCLLVIDSLYLGDSKLGDIVSNMNSQIAVLLSGNNHIDMFRTSQNTTPVIPGSVARKVILFSTSNAATSQHYAEMIGKYEKQMESVNDSQQDRDTFFKKKERHYNVSITESFRIRPEELANLGQGAVLIQDTISGGSNSKAVVVARQLVV